MAEYRGLTIRIAADTTRFDEALRKTTTLINRTQRQLSDLKRAMVLNPDNRQLGAQYFGELQQQAANAASKLDIYRSKMADLGSTLSTVNPSKTIAELAAQTTDASLAALRAKETYSNLDDGLGNLYTQITEISAAWGNGKVFNHENNDLDEIRAELEEILSLAQSGEDIELIGLSADKIDAIVSQVERMKNAWKEADAEYTDARLVEQFEGLTREGVKADAIIQQMARSLSEMSRSPLADGIEADMKKFELLSDDADRAADRFKALDSALKLDPKNIDIARQRAEALADATQASREKADQLRAVIQRYKDAGIDRVVADTKNLASAAADARSKFDAANEKVARLTAKLVDAKAEANALKAQDDLGEAYQNAADRVERLEAELKDASNAAKEAGDEFHRLDDAINLQGAETQLQGVENELQTMENAAKTAHENITTAAFLILEKIGESARQAIQKVIDTTYELQDAYANMRKTVNTTDEGYQELYDNAVEASLVQPVSAAQILNVEALGGQLGFAADKLEDFQRVANGLDISTNMDWSQAATDMARFANIMDMDPDNVDRYGSAIVELGNNFATTESEISDMALRIAGAGATLGLSEADVLGLSTALTSMGLTAEAGGSSISQIMIKIEKAVANGTDGIKQYAEDAGMSVQDFIEHLNSLDADGLEEIASQYGMTASQFKQDTIDSFKQVELWAETAGYKSATDFAEAWSNKPIEALQAIFSGMTPENLQDGTNLSILLDELGVKTIRQSDVARRLANNADLLTDAVASANNAWEENIALDTEVSRRNEALSGRMDTLRNAVTGIGTELGEGLLPIVNVGIDFMSTVVRLLDELPTPLKTATIGVMGLTAGLASAIPIYNFAHEQMGKFVENAIKAQGPMASLVGPIVKLKTSISEFVKNSGGMVGAAKNIATSLMNIGSTGAIAAGMFGALAAVVGGVLITNYIKAEAATRDYVNAISNSGKWMGTMVDWTDAYSEALGNSTYKIHEVKDVTAELTEQIVSHNQAMTEIEEGARTSGEQLQRYKDVLVELGGQGALTTEQHALLQWAIDGINETLGTNITLEQALSGTYEDEEGNIHSVVEELSALIEQRQIEARLAADQSLYTEAIENQSRLERAQRDAQETFEDYMALRRDSFRQDAKWAQASDEELNEYILTVDEHAQTLEGNVQKTSLAVSKGADDVRAALSLMANHTALADLGYDVEEVIEQMQIAGLTSADLANISSDEFRRMAENCGGNVMDLVQAILDYGKTEPESPKLDVDNTGALEGTEEASIAIAALPDGKTVYITADTSALYGALDYAEQRISTFTSSASAIISGKFGGGNAAGGIRFHAYGGIVDRPSWLGTRDIVGEAGAEAIIPLTNRKYVSPFADTVADELMQKLGSGGGDNITIQLNYEAGTDATTMVRDLARQITMHKATRGRW